MVKKSQIGTNTKIHQYVNIYGCEVGDDCIIGPFVEIQADVKIGNRVKIQSHSFICQGVVLEDEVFIGHGVVFTNDKYPRSTTVSGKLKKQSDWRIEKTVIHQRAAIGSNATILPGITIGKNAVIGAGAVVTKNVPAGKIVAGNPAKVIAQVHDTL